MFKLTNNHLFEAFYLGFCGELENSPKFLLTIPLHDPDSIELKKQFYAGQAARQKNKLKEQQQILELIG